VDLREPLGEPPLPLEQPRPLERLRRLLGEREDEAAVLLVDVEALRKREREHADAAVLHPERHGDPGALAAAGAPGLELGVRGADRRRIVEPDRSALREGVGVRRARAERELREPLAEAGRVAVPEEELEPVVGRAVEDRPLARAEPEKAAEQDRRHLRGEERRGQRAGGGLQRAEAIGEASLRLVQAGALERLRALPRDGEDELPLLLVEHALRVEPELERAARAIDDERDRGRRDVPLRLRERRDRREPRAHRLERREPHRLAGAIRLGARERRVRADLPVPVHELVGQPEAVDELELSRGALPEERHRAGADEAEPAVEDEAGDVARGRRRGERGGEILQPLQPLEAEPGGVGAQPVEERLHGVG
jgi:hypothetical protein